MRISRALAGWSLGVALAISSGAGASVVTVTPGNPQGWASNGNSGGGSSSITATSLGGAFANGALQLNGDRTRFEVTNTTTGFGLLSNLTTYNYQWAVESIGAGVATAQAPALRALVFSPGTGRSLQFIWEDGEQSSQQFVPPGGSGSLNTIDSGDFFGPAATGRVYVYTSGLGRGLYTGGGTLISGSDSAQSLGSLITTLNDPNANVYGFSLGVGSSVGSGFRGYADNLRVGFGTGEVTTYDFATIGVAAVPEPSTLGGAVFAIACGLGFAWRRRRA